MSFDAGYGKHKCDYYHKTLSQKPFYYRRTCFFDQQHLGGYHKVEERILPNPARHKSPK